MEENLNLVEGANIELIRTGDEVSINNTYQYDDTAIEAEIQQVAASLESYSLITETGSKVQIEFNNTNYKMKVKLLDKNDNVINTSNEIDLPIEQLVKSITYDSETKEIVFTLQDGTQTRVPLSDLISGLVTEEQLDNEVEKLQADLDYYKTIYNVLPKVEGNGENITLDNTAESILKMVLYGNTSQKSTTGINLFDKLTGGTYSGITLTQNDDGSFILNGTSDASNFKQFAFENDIVIPSGSYSLYVEANKGISTNSLNISLYDTSNNQVCNKDYNNVSNLKDVINFSVNEETTIRGFRSWVGNGNSASNVIIKCMLVSGTYTTSTIPSYEEYTGGIASPNPDYPQQIHEVSGDNEINIEGKNLLGILQQGGLNNGSETSSTNRVRTDFIQVKSNEKYTISNLDTIVNQTGISFYDENKNFISAYSSGGWVGTPVTITTLENAKYIRIMFRNTSNADITPDLNYKIMLNEGNTATTYEPYNGDTYELDLGVLGKNIFDGKVEQGAINSNAGQTYAQCKTSNATRIRTIDLIKLDTSKTYTISIKNGYSYVVQPFNNEGKLYDTGVGGYGQWKTTSFNITNVPYIALAFRNTSETNITPSEIDSLEVMLEVGTSASPYEKYNPFKMRGIGTYEDYFTKNTGKNKLAPTSNEINETISGVKREGKNGVYTISGTASASGGGNVKYALTNTYTIQNGDYLHLCNASTTYNASFILFDDNDTQINDYSINAVNRIIDLSTYAGKVIKSIGLYNNSSFNANVSLSPMILNNVSSTTGFEPFGKDMWCKYNAVGNIVLDGDSIMSGFSSHSGTTYITANYQDGSIKQVGENQVGIKCDKLRGTNINNTWTGNMLNSCSLSANGKYIQICLPYSVATTLQELRDWLSSNNLTMDYWLSSPYLSLIENETLISQLDAIEKALGKDGQTNISQVNNDVSFVITATALRDLSNLVNEEE